LRRGFFFSLLLSQKSSSHSIRKSSIFAAKNFPDGDKECNDKNDSDGHEGSATIIDTNQEEEKTKSLFFNEQRNAVGGDWPER